VWRAETLIDDEYRIAALDTADQRTPWISASVNLQPSTQAATQRSRVPCALAEILKVTNKTISKQILCIISKAPSFSVLGSVTILSATARSTIQQAIPDSTAVDFMGDTIDFGLACQVSAV
jgi:hypothetical protein